MATELLDPKALFLKRYYAHRGLHNIKQAIPENSLAAFKAAIAAGFGVELDVQLSSDGQVMVFHDSSLKRMCGIDRKLEDLPYEELAALKLAGTAETICLFEDVLTLFADTGLPIIVELKKTKRRNELCEKTYALLKKYAVIACVESFDPQIVRWFYLHDKERFRGQLACPAESYPKSTSRIAVFFLSRCLLLFWNRPDFIAYKIGPRPARIKKLRKKGLPFICWTSRSAEDGFSDNDALIFENYLPQDAAFHT